MSNKHVFSTNFSGPSVICVEIGELGQTSQRRCLVRHGDTVVLSAAVASKKVGTGDFSR